ncbi:MAG: endonuclease/exonuclease/phosphatase family protein [Gemmatimonadota bacterium]
MRRSYRGLIGSLVLVVSSCALPRTSGEPHTVRVMSYNIAAGHGDLDRIAATIRAEAPEIVALQEVDVHWHARSGFADQAAVLAKALGMDARFAHIYDLDPTTPGAPRREYGVAILSKHPIVEFHNHTIARLSTVNEGTPATPMPGFLEVVLDVGGTRVRVFDTHIDYRPDPAVRVKQVAEMLAIIGEPSAPTLLFGDLNAPPIAPELQPLLRRLHDSWPEANGPGLTYPATEPVKRIDYVLTSRHFRVQTMRVPVTEASDHRPVTATLMMYP